MRVGVPPRLTAAPRVDYPDWDDFSRRCAELHSTYSGLVQGAVARRKIQTQSFNRPRRGENFQFSSHDLMVCMIDVAFIYS